MLCFPFATCLGDLRFKSFARQSLAWISSLALLISLSTLSAQAQGPMVLGYERVHANAAPTADAGRLLMSELSCSACHVGRAVEFNLPKLGPSLDNVGERIHADYLKQFLASPHATRPGTTMPDLLGAMGEEERAATATALAAYLAGSQTPRVLPPTTSAAQLGAELFSTVGCTVCHADSQVEGSTGIPLEHIDEKTSIPALTAFLIDPLQTRTSGRMPRLGLSDEEAQAIASFLLKDIQVPANLRYRYYEGTWSSLPDFSTLEVKSEGTASSLNPAVGERRDNFGVIFDTYLLVPQDGRYTFHLGSDDGSRLLIDGEVVATMDGVHPVQYASNAIELKAGAHELQIEFFEGGGGEELYLQWEGPGIQRTNIEAWFSPDGKPLPTASTEIISQELIEKGRKEFLALGCASCHQRRDLEGETARERTGIRNPDNGCLGQPDKAPRFNLTDHQRDSLKLAIAATENNPSDQGLIDNTLVQFNCIACHQRGELGGLEARHDSIFKTTQQEMGDEGRLPPPLTGIGAKLQREWMSTLLDRGAHDRFYMSVRMPGFGLRNVGHLIDPLEKVDQLETKVEVATEEPQRRLRAAGRQLVGDQGQSCIKCHVFGNQPATGIQAISMTTMTRRLKEDWFLAYMLNPNALRPGTRMPESWPGGATFFPKLLDGKASTQIHAVWEYLSEGDNAPLPSGLGAIEAELIPVTEPLIYRNFIEGAGARAIAVGYPERANLAFDAEQLRLALAWQGRFIDAGLHWTGRGVGFQRPLGDNVLAMPNGPGVIVTDNVDASWPNDNVRNHGGHFRGYRFDEARRPVFLYDAGQQRVSDTFVPTSDPRFPGFTRSITVDAGDKEDGKSIVFRVASAESINALDDGTFQTSDGLTIIPQQGTTLMPRSIDGRAELLWVVPSGEAQQASFEYRW